MDREKIGKFIAKCRKDKLLTQEQFAEMLHITNKSVSKWENGSCLPDASLYEPLCRILDITIDELFAGQRGQGEPLLQMLTYKLYQSSDQRIPFDQFSRALKDIAELVAVLKTFDTKQDAVDFMVAETNVPPDECARAYDFYMGLFQ